MGYKNQPPIALRKLLIINSIKQYLILTSAIKNQC